MRERFDERCPTTRRAIIELALGVGAGLGLMGSTAAVRAAQSSEPLPAASPVARARAAGELTIKVGAIDIAYRLLGQGDPLLMIMGSASTMDLWDPTLLEALAARYLLILFDNRGMGGSTNTGPYEFTQLADDTAGLMEALGVGPAHVFGWSMGGSIALDLTVRRPELVTKAVLYAADCGGPHAIPPSPEVIAALTNTTGTREEQGRRLLPLIIPEAWLRRNGAYVRRIFSQPMAPVAPEAVALQGRAISRWSGVYEQLPRVTRPTMIVQGMEDVITPPQNAQILADAIPGSWLIRLAGDGHGAMFQEPKRLAALTSEFLSE